MADSDNPLPTNIYRAISSENQEQIKIYLDQGLDINHTLGRSGAGGSNFLQYAILLRSYKVAKYLVDRGIDLRYRNENGDSSLQLVLTGSEDTALYIAKAMVKKNISLDSQNNDDLGRLSALHEAIYYRKIHLTTFLLQNNANPDLQSVFGNTPLHAAVTKALSPRKDYRFVKLLIEKAHPNPFLKNDEGKTPLDIIVTLPTQHPLRVLLDKYAASYKKNS